MALFFGRLHPLLVHLPIAIILLLGLLELLARRTRFHHANSGAGLLLALATPAAVVTALCGWLLALGGGYQDRLLQWHRWTGVGTALICVVTAALYRFNFKKAYQWSLFAGCVVLAVASHFGGSLTHGSDYLVHYAPQPFRKWLGGAGTESQVASKKLNQDPEVFAAIVQPILQQNCIGCHGPEKSKGGLRLDSFQSMLKGGENGPAVVPGKPLETLLLKRTRLPLSSDDHMPPDGKPQPTSADLALLEWWVQNGAPTNKTVAQMKATPAVGQILASRLGLPLPVARVVTPKPLDQVLPAATKLGDDLNIVVSALSPSEPWLQCTASIAGTNFGDADLARLAPLGPNVRWLDLGGTAVTDSGLAALISMPNVSRLHLERTAVTDSGLGHLGELSHLEYLNLHHTAITDNGLQALGGLPKLKQVYLWETKVTPEAAKMFADVRSEKEQVEQWQKQIEELNAKIRQAHAVVDLGDIPAPAASTNTAPVNSTCPVSGKAIDPAKTVTYEGKLIAFCCDDCKAKFEKDPKTFLAKLEPVMPKESKPQSSK